MWLVIGGIIPERECREAALKYNSTQLGALIKATRKKLGLTQENLAMTAGTGLRFIVDLEKGKPTCQIEKALKVLHTLGIEITLSPPNEVQSRFLAENQEPK